MGDRMKALSGQGPTVEFAADLRKAKIEARNITFKAMVKAMEGAYVVKTLSKAVNGKALPTWPVTEAFLQACGVTGDDLSPWHDKWTRAHYVQNLLRPDGLTHHPTRDEVWALLRDVMHQRGVTVDSVLTRTDLMPPHLAITPQWVRPSADTVTAARVDWSNAAHRDLIILILAACGAAHDDIMYWLKHLPSPGEAVAGGEDTQGPPTPVDALPSRPAPRRRLAIVGAGLAIAVGAGLVMFVAWPTAEQQRLASRPRSLDQAGAAPSAPPALERAVRPARPARPALAQLAARTARSKAAAAASTGTVTYIYTTVWNRDDMSDADEPFDLRDEQLWRRQDGSGLLRIIPRPPDGPVEQPADPLAPATDRVLTPAASSTPAVEPNSDPGILAAQLRDIEPGIETPAAVLRSVAQLYRRYCLQPAQRAAVLRLLADTAGLVSDGEALDRIDRKGLQIGAREAGNTVLHRALFDTTTGALLYFETQLVPATASPVTGPTVTQATAFRSCGNRHSIG